MPITHQEVSFGHYGKSPLLYFLAHEKRVPSPLRRSLRSIFRHHKADVELDGIKFRCYPNQNYQDLAIARGNLFRKEREEFAFMEARLKDGGCFVDIGANMGAVSIPLAVHCPALQTVIAIEPNPANVEHLQYNAALNGVRNIAIMPYAVGPAGKVRLWMNSAANSGQASLHDFRKKRSKTSIEVEAKPLLDILREAGATGIELLKIDIEGFEDQALMPFFRDAPASLRPKAVNIEHSLRKAWQEDCIGRMQSLGYTIETATKSNTMLVPP